MRTQRKQDSVHNMSSVFVKRMVMMSRNRKSHRPPGGYPEERPTAWYGASKPGETRPSPKHAERRPWETDAPTWRDKDDAGQPAVRPTVALNRGSELQRNVTAVLNKVTPENMHLMVAEVAKVCADKAGADMLAERLFHFASSFGQYTGTYAVLVVLVRERLPVPVRDALDAALAARSEMVPGYGADEKKRSVAAVAFIGALFVERVVVLPVLGLQLAELLQLEGTERPSEVALECGLALIKAAGCALEQAEGGQALLAQAHAKIGGVLHLYPKRLQFLADDLLALASNGWRYKSFVEVAETRDALYEKHRCQTLDGRFLSPAFEERIAGAPSTDARSRRAA